MLTRNEIRTEMLGASKVPDVIINDIHEQRWLQVWVPKIYGGLGYRFGEGLSSLFEWAKTDGSLGWMLTLCAGANFFSRNLKPNIGKELFSDSKTCFGGSGMIGGTAEQLHDGNYLINGLWHFATGAPHLSHFTLNAKLTKNGTPIIDENGNEIIRSFIIPKDQAEIIPNWKSMGMKATGTHSFKVNNAEISEDYSFVYDQFFTDDALDRIPFRVFADLTLLVNYLGMAAHFLEEAVIIRSYLKVDPLHNWIESNLEVTLHFADEIECILNNSELVSSEKQSEIHEFGISLVENLSHKVLQVYIQLGIQATHTDSVICRIFSDFFTATMHSNFRPALTDGELPDLHDRLFMI
ncbi:hypothetical protein VUJ46_04445 [Chryseobacterium sp. MYb264]|uniref:hypothetical protein n=1 Tax=Chryseobacterium sp. MYb264 TaxID=2745153 RepID=UPI002E0E06D9|nr:hypothetical protein VUJ46_04445 [Chryseobacterium sp. MYb264]